MKSSCHKRDNWRINRKSPRASLKMEWPSILLWETETISQPSVVQKTRNYWMGMSFLSISIQRKDFHGVIWPLQISTGYIFYTSGAKDRGYMCKCQPSAYQYFPSPVYLRIARDIAIKKTWHLESFLYRKERKIYWCLADSDIDTHTPSELLYLSTYHLETIDIFWNLNKLHPSTGNQYWQAK